MKRARDDDDGPPKARRPRQPRRAPVADPHAIADAYSWDERQNEKNWSKHSVGFETAVLAFEDPRQITSPPETIGGERRWQTVGMAGPGLMLLVVHTRRRSSPDRIHIISARRLTKTERLLFDDAKAGHSTQILGHAATSDDRGWFGSRGYRRRAFAKQRVDNTE
jgi:uncharacterized DUF497 family protein